MSSSPGSPASRSSPRRRGRNTGGSSPAATAPDTGTPVPGTPIAGTPRSERSPIVLTPSRGWASEVQHHCAFNAFLYFYCCAYRVVVLGCLQSSERDGSEVTDQASKSRCACASCVPCLCYVCSFYCLTVIWGTTVNIQKAMEVFRHFFNDYRVRGTVRPACPQHCAGRALTGFHIFRHLVMMILSRITAGCFRS